MPSGQRETTVSVPLTPTRSDLYWRRIFNKYDKDKDGRISYVELKDIIESREYDHDLPNNVVEKIMSLADRDNSGYLDFQEFVEMMHNPDLKAVFGHFVARYVHSIIPHRDPIDTTGRNHRNPRPVCIRNRPSYLINRMNNHKNSKVHIVLREPTQNKSVQTTPRPVHSSNRISDGSNETRSSSSGTRGTFLARELRKTKLRVLIRGSG